MQNVSDKEPALKNFVVSKYYKLQNEYSDALLAMEQYENSVDSVFIANAYQEIGVPLSDYHSLSRELDATRMRLAKMITGILIVIIVLILLVIAFIFRYHVEELKKQTLLIVSLNEDIQALERNRTSNLTTIRQLLRTKYSLVDQAAVSQQQLPNKTDIAMRNLWDKATRQIQSFSNDGEFLKQVEAEIKGCYRSIMKNLRTDLPNLKEIDYKIFLFSIIGFSIPSICLITGEENATKIYERCRRLKNKIQALPESKKSLYLKFLPGRSGE